jgi:hypothetical protein
MSDAVDRILQIGLGFWPSKALLTAVEFDLFTLLGKGPLTGEEIRAQAGWHPRGVHDLLDGLVALGLLEREGNGPEAKYRNGADAAAHLDKNQPGYMGGILEMANARLFRYWADLGTAMRTGQPLRLFLDAMTGLSVFNFRKLAEVFDFSRYETLCDVGGAAADLSICVARRHRKLRCISFDLPPVESIARENIAAAGLGERIRTVSGDFFEETLPRADVVTMGMILHDWSLERKKALIEAAHAALPRDGAFIVVESLIDDERRKNVMGLMMSLNMLIEFGEAFDYTAADFQGWCREAGFRRFEVLPLLGASSAAVAYK